MRVPSPGDPAYGRRRGRAWEGPSKKQAQARRAAGREPQGRTQLPGECSRGDAALWSLTLLHHQQSPVPCADALAQHLHSAHVDPSVTASGVPDVQLSLVVTEEAGRGKRGQAAPELWGPIPHLLPQGHLIPVPCDRANGRCPLAGIEGAGQKGSGTLLGMNFGGLGHPERAGS